MMMIKKSGKIPRWVFFVIPLLLVLATATGVGVHFLKKAFWDPKAVDIKLSQNPDFVRVNIDATLLNAGDAPKVKVLEKDWPIDNGKVHMEIPVGPVHLGPNALEGFLVLPNGKEGNKVVFEFELLKYWQPVPGNLGGNPPVYTISFQTIPDRSVIIGGQPAGGSKPGQYEWNKSMKEILGLAPPAGADVSNWVFEVPWEMRLKGKKEESGIMKVEIPAVLVQINRPAAGAKVAQDFVDCTGITEPESEVKINGAPVEVKENVFATKVPLPVTGPNKIVVDVFNPRRGPRQVVIEVVRVESLEAEIEAYGKTVEKDLGWETLARDPEVLKGKHVSIHGRIISFSTIKGLSVFQILVDEGCPQDARCTVKVDFKGETSAGKDSWVTLLGEVTGKFTVQTSDGKKFDVPSIEAVYVIRDEDEAAAKGKKKKKGK